VTTTTILRKPLGFDAFRCGVAAACVFLAPYAFASDAPGPSAPSAPTVEAASTLTEIVVTAQRREESIAKVPISVTAFSQKTMDDLHIENFTDLALIVPGLTIQTSTQDSTDVAIRGIYSGGNAPTTQFYIDETPVGIRRMDGGGPSTSPHPIIFDLDRVEVLRGPQGTLFGSSAMGGAIRYITPQPNLTDSSGYSKADYGYTDRGAPSYEVGLAYGAPVVDGKAAYRMSAWYQSAGGWIDRYDPYSGSVVTRNANYGDSYVLRPAFTWAPTENLTITPAMFVQHINTHDPDLYWVRYTPTPAQSALAAPVVSPQTQQALERGAHSSGSLPEPGTDNLRVTSLAIKYNFHGMTFQSDTSYVDRESLYVNDYTHPAEQVFGGTPFVKGINYYNFSTALLDIAYTHAWLQEFRLTSQDPSARVTWVAGANYRYADEGLSQLIPGSLDVLTEAIAGENTFQFTGNQLDVINGQVFNGYSDFLGRDVQEALFGEVALKIVGGVKANVGVRVEHSVVSNQYQALGGPTNGESSPITTSLLPDQVGNPVTPRAALTWQYTDNDMVYVSAAKGYRAGGGNSAEAISSPFCQPSLAELGLTAAPESFNSDSLWSYEAGFKDTLLDRRLSIQGSAFYIDWSDIQTVVSLPSCATVFTANRGKATSEGFDLQVAAIVAESLKLSAAVGYDNAYYPNAAYGAPGANGVAPLLNAEGDKLKNVIPWTANVDAEYSRDIATVWANTRSYIRVDYRWLAAVNALNPNVAGFDKLIGPYQNPAYSILNIRLGVVHEGLDLSAYVDNATNSDPIFNYKHNTKVGPLISGVAIRPLTAGVTAFYRF
jgi:iron complex outermembrane receptor protein